MRPNYLVIGAPKCATSTLCHQLGRHPSVFMTEPKELYFFSDDETWARGWEWYESFFGGVTNETAVGEGTTDYTMLGRYPNAVPRIAQHLPEAKLIYIVRDPLDRIVSHWMHLRSRANRETRPLNQAVREREEYIDHSSYWRQISAYREHFPDEQILVLFFDDFTRDQPGVMRSCFRFLGVDPDVDLAEEHLHSSTSGRVDKPAMSVLRRVPGFTALRDRSPGMIRDSLRKVLKKPFDSRPTWSDDARRWAIEQLREDSRAILSHCGKPPDFWPWLTE